MIDTISARLARGIKNTVPEHPASLAVLKFAIAVVLNVAFIIALTLGASLFTGNTTEAALILISFAMLRQVTGGVHLKSGTACVLLTTALFTLLSYVDMNTAYVQVLNVTSLALVLWLAPIGIERQTRIPKRHWPKLKGIAAALIILNILFCSPVIAASFFVQSITLLLTWKGVKSI
ncbi:accessory gene regulator B family protein [Paenibacillus sp. S150]|uniref:accessory gene regulator B family protein n=1 Tax=Paenibacillus sp. S150 TaxID=2749826 RepID=UPI001C59A5CB|nr:accessory gene regulator B family protein [Paenibacillus sp. S150]MBW4085810.1 accessory gene regulator B family protein [Paenibacillus sp. S150]